MARAPRTKHLIADHEMTVMGRIYDLLATLQPPRRKAVYDFIGLRLDDMPVIAEVKEPEAVPMFPDSETRTRHRTA